MKKIYGHHSPHFTTHCSKNDICRIGRFTLAQSGDRNCLLFSCKHRNPCGKGHYIRYINNWNRHFRRYSGNSYWGWMLCFGRSLVCCI